MGTTHERVAIGCCIFVLFSSKMALNERILVFYCVYAICQLMYILLCFLRWLGGGYRLPSPLNLPVIFDLGDIAVVACALIK